MEEARLEMHKVSFTHRSWEGGAKDAWHETQLGVGGEMKSSEFGSMYVVSQVPLTLLFLRQTLLLT